MEWMQNSTSHQRNCRTHGNMRNPLCCIHIYSVFTSCTCSKVAVANCEPTCSGIEASSTTLRDIEPRTTSPIEASIRASMPSTPTPLKRTRLVCLGLASVCSCNVFALRVCPYSGRVRGGCKPRVAT